MRILVVEDEIDLAKAVKQTLEEEGFACDMANDGEEGLLQAESWDYDAIVLDLMMPKMDGWTVLNKLRKTKETPVLILTARDAVPDRVRGLNSGADDYLTKPFELDELLARLRALIRRSAGKPDPVVKINGISIDTSSQTVKLKGKPVDISPKEYALLEYLIMHRGELVTRTMIYDHIYNEDDPTMSNVLDVYVSNLRKKLGSDLIQTRRGKGYMIP